MPIILWVLVGAIVAAVVYALVDFRIER